MKYFTIHINDSGAIEDSDEQDINGQRTLICKLYDDEEFNSLNDILHSLADYILNDRTLSLFEQSKVIPYELTPVIVKRNEVKFGLFKSLRSYSYNQLKIKEPKDLHCYNWINFKKSEINILKGEVLIEKLSSHEDLLKYIDENYKISSRINEFYSLKIPTKEKEEKTKELQTFSWETKKIVFNNEFDSSIDVFKIPFYSWGTYISQRFKDLLLKKNIADIGFAETKEDLGKVWKPHFPVIEFE